jgi:hypothetical protein
MLATHKDLALKLDEMEKRYDHRFGIVFDAIRNLMSPGVVFIQKAYWFFSSQQKRRMKRTIRLQHAQAATNRGVFDYARSRPRSRLRPSQVLPFLDGHKVAVPTWFFAARYPARQCLCLRFVSCLATSHAKLEVRTVRYSFPVRLFHSRLHAGLSRRTDVPFLSISMSHRQVEEKSPGRSDIDNPCIRLDPLGIVPGYNSPCFEA